MFLNNNNNNNNNTFHFCSLFFLYCFNIFVEFEIRINNSMFCSVLLLDYIVRHNMILIIHTINLTVGIWAFPTLVIDFKQKWKHLNECNR